MKRVLDARSSLILDTQTLSDSNYQMSEVENHEQLKGRLAEYLRVQRIRQSGSRAEVFDILLRTEGHLTLSELVRRAKRREVGEATVYRALQTLQNAGVVSRVEPLGGQVSYEAVLKHHDHMICTVCQGIQEFCSPEIERLQLKIAEALSFHIERHRHEIFGLCKSCHRNKKGETKC